MVVNRCSNKTHKSIATYNCCHALRYMKLVTNWTCWTSSSTMGHIRQYISCWNTEGTPPSMYHSSTMGLWLIDHSHYNYHINHLCCFICRRGARLSSAPRLTTLHWHHNGRDGISNHQPQDCLHKHLLRRRSKKTSKLRVTGLCVGNSPHKWSVTLKMFPLDDVIMISIHNKSASVHEMLRLLI